jgi:hypothetical protein
MSMRGLWASVEISPGLQKKLHWTLALFWLAAFPAIIILGLEDSVPLLVFISVYANFVGHISSAQAAQVEVRQDEVEQKRDEEDDADLDNIEAKVDSLHENLLD